VEVLGFDDGTFDVRKLGITVGEIASRFFAKLNPLLNIMALLLLIFMLMVLMKGFISTLAITDFELLFLATASNLQHDNSNSNGTNFMIIAL